MFRVFRLLGIVAMPALFAVATASAQTPPPAPAPAPAPAPTPAPAPDSLSVYEGEYLLTQGNKQADLKIWVEEGSLRGQINDGDPTTLRSSGAHRFLHGTNPNIWLVFTIENGKAVSVEMNMRGNIINGTRKQ